ncbi:MAG: UDP-N-acetylmuramate--alanine ligase [Tannerellaceae bacterium]
MRRVHCIAVTEPLIFDLLRAIREKGYEVSASDEMLTDEMVAALRAAGCLFYPKGWNPNYLTKDIHYVVLGATVRPDNPELIRARELGLLILSIPEFIFQQTKDKMRVVVFGHTGKEIVLSMIVSALKRQKLAFDYALTDCIPELPDRVNFSYESRIALIDGDEQPTLIFEKGRSTEFYRPHIAILANLTWGEGAPSLDVCRKFTASIEREGKLIYYDNDPIMTQLAAQVRDDITAMPYHNSEIVEFEGATCLQTRYGNYHVRILNADFPALLNAARLACRQMGVKDTDFYQSLSDYSLSLQA